MKTPQIPALDGMTPLGIKPKSYRTALELAKAIKAPAPAAPAKTWREELAAGVFPAGLTDAGLDRHDFADISKQTLKGIIDAAYSRGMAEAIRDARLPHNAQKGN